VIITPDQRFAISGCADKSVKVFDLETRKEVFHFQDVLDGTNKPFAVTKDSRFLLTGSSEKTIKIWDLDKFQEVHQFKEAHECIELFAE